MSKTVYEHLTKGKKIFPKPSEATKLFHKNHTKASVEFNGEVKTKNLLIFPLN